MVKRQGEFFETHLKTSSTVDIPAKLTIPKNVLRENKMFETLKCLRDEKNIGGGWMDGGDRAQRQY